MSRACTLVQLLLLFALVKFITNTKAYCYRCPFGFIIRGLYFVSPFFFLPLIVRNLRLPSLKTLVWFESLVIITCLTRLKFEYNYWMSIPEMVILVSDGWSWISKLLDKKGQLSHMTGKFTLIFCQCRAPTSKATPLRKDDACLTWQGILVWKNKSLNPKMLRKGPLPFDVIPSQLTWPLTILIRLIVLITTIWWLTSISLFVLILLGFSYDAWWIGSPRISLGISERERERER